VINGTDVVANPGADQDAIAQILLHVDHAGFQGNSLNGVQVL
jgi:hypothetical protein